MNSSRLRTDVRNRLGVVPEGHRFAVPLNASLVPLGVNLLLNPSAQVDPAQNRWMGFSRIDWILQSVQEMSDPSLYVREAI